MRYLIFAVVFGVVLSSTAWTEESFYQPVLEMKHPADNKWSCLLYTSPSPRDGLLSRMPSSA